MQLSKELVHELYKEAQTNGFNKQEYGLLLTAVDNIINNMTLHTQEYTKNIKPEDYEE